MAVIRNLREYLISEWRAHLPTSQSELDDDKHVNLFKGLPGVNVKVPIQTNFFDCGIYMLQYVESFFKVHCTIINKASMFVIDWFVA